MATSYVTPQLITNAPTGISWSIIPEPGADLASQQAEAVNICWRATSIVDTYCNQVLRATADTEYLTGPGAQRVAVDPDTWLGTLVMRRWPVTDVLAILLSPNRSFPRVWSPIPAGQYEVTHPLINSVSDTASATGPDGGWSITVAPGYIPPMSRCGRNSTRLQVSYNNGWAHTSLTAPAAAGASSIQVDDVTGWVGASGFVYDGSSTETTAGTAVTATVPLVLPNGAGTAQAGPGTVTLASPLTYSHAAGTMVSALPANVIQASILACAVQGLESGIEAVVIPTIPGSQTTGGHGVEDLEGLYKEFLEHYVRVA